LRVIVFHNNVEISLTEQDEILTLDIHFIAFLGSEEHTIANADGADVRTYRLNLGPHQPLRHLRGCGDEDARTATSFTIVVYSHKDTVK
jgi:hypothetical protein